MDSVAAPFLIDPSSYQRPDPTAVDPARSVLTDPRPTQAFPAIVMKGLKAVPGPLPYAAVTFRRPSGARALMVLTENRFYVAANQNFLVFGMTADGFRFPLCLTSNTLGLNPHPVAGFFFSVGGPIAGWAMAQSIASADAPLYNNSGMMGDAYRYVGVLPDLLQLVIPGCNSNMDITVRGVWLYGED